MPAATIRQRDELVHAAEARALYAALWCRSQADELREVLPAEAFAGRAGLVWTLVGHHDATADPWADVEPSTASWSGPDRVTSILAAAQRLDVSPSAAVLDGHAATLRQARRVGLIEHGIVLASVAPAAGWTLTLAEATHVLCLAPTYRDAAEVLTQLDALAASVLTPTTASARRNHDHAA